MQRRPRGGQKPLRSTERTIGSLEAELAQKMQAYQEAQKANGELQQRAKVLEVMLSAREQRLQHLKQTHRPERPLGSAVQPFSAWRVTEAPATSSDNSSADVRLSPPSEEEVGTSGRSSPHDLALTVQGRAAAWQAAVQRTPAAAAPTPQAAATASASGALVITEPGPCGTPAYAIQQCLAVWNSLVRDGAILLHAHDARPYDPVPKLRLAEVVERSSRHCHALVSQHPLLCMDISGINCETGVREECPMPTHWLSVVQALRLAPEQVADCRAALGLHQDRLRAVREERRGLAQQLADCMAAYRTRRQPAQQQQPWRQAAEPEVQQAAGGCVSCGELLLRVSDVSAQLQRNLERERQAVEMMTDFLFDSLLTLPQAVRFCVLCHPYAPDVVAFLSTVAEAGGAVAADALAAQRL